MLNLVLIGLNHRTAEVEVRERAAFEESKLPAVLQELTGRPGIREAFILSTCNRVEVLSHVDDIEQGLRDLQTFICTNKTLSPEELRRSLYMHTRDEAVRHLFRVASSLDSMILGEPQILGQVKAFYGIAGKANALGPHLHSLLQSAFRVAKRVRSETGIGEYSVSVSSAAVDLARKVLGELRGRSILIVGAGKMGETAIRHLLSGGASRIRVANRSLEAAQALAAGFDGSAVPFAELSHWIAKSDVVIASTGSRDILISRQMAESIMRERKNAPIVFIDISVPRNVDPAVGEVDNVFCYDIDDLGAVVEANLHERRRAAAHGQKIIDQEVESACARLEALEVTPLVVQLQSKLEAICRMELERYLNKTGPRDEKEIRELESMVARIAGKIAHPLVTQLKANHTDPAHREASLATIRRIFGISSPESK